MTQTREIDILILEKKSEDKLMVNLVNGFLSYLVLLIIFVIVIGIAVAVGITLRKMKNQKIVAETEMVEASEKTEE